MVRAVGAGLGLLLAFNLLPGAVLGIGAVGFEQYRYAPSDNPPTDVDTSPPAHDPELPTAVVVVGNGGANVADVLAPYEVLASTGAFNTYVVAPERRPVTLLGGLDLLPDLSFAELDRRLEGSAPDVTVVPEMPPSEDHDEQVVTWLRDTASKGLVLGVCAGVRLVADAGLLYGHEATSHWYRLPEIEGDHPGVRWLRGVRYVDAGEVITTGGLLSSVDGTLRVVERLVTEQVAADAARAIGWPHYSPGRSATIPRSQITWSERMLHLLNIGFRSTTTTVGVVITEGVGELDLAAAFDPYAEVRAARTLAIGPRPVRSRHGLTFLPRAGLDAVGTTDRLLVPGTAAAANHPQEIDLAAERSGVPITYLHTRSGFAFDAALQAMAAATDVPTARWAGKILEYSTEEITLPGPQSPWAVALRPLALGVAGLMVALGVSVLIRRRRSR